MNSYRLLGIVLAVAGGVGYAVGVTVRYPGRAFSITVIMLGIALAAISSSEPEGQA